MLLDERGPELPEFGRAEVLDRGKQSLAVFSSEGDDLRLSGPGAFELVGCHIEFKAAEPAGKLKHQGQSD